MRNYEAMLIIKPDLKEEAMKAVSAKISETITQNSGEVEEARVWGKRQLAFPIGKFDQGLFYLVHFRAEAKAISNLKREYKLDENILRTLIISKHT